MWRRDRDYLEDSQREAPLIWWHLRGDMKPTKLSGEEYWQREQQDSLKWVYCAWLRSSKKASVVGAIGAAKGVVGLVRFKRLRVAMLSVGACGPL